MDPSCIDVNLSEDKRSVTVKYVKDRLPLGKRCIVGLVKCLRGIIPEIDEIDDEVRKVIAAEDERLGCSGSKAKVSDSNSISSPLFDLAKDLTSCYFKRYVQEFRDLAREVSRIESEADDRKNKKSAIDFEYIGNMYFDGVVKDDLLTAVRLLELGESAVEIVRAYCHDVMAHPKIEMSALCKVMKDFNYVRYLLDDIYDAITESHYVETEYALQESGYEKAQMNERELREDVAAVITEKQKSKLAQMKQDATRKQFPIYYRMERLDEKVWKTENLTINLCAQRKVFLKQNI